jgi:hypothetical protein
MKQSSSTALRSPETHCTVAADRGPCPTKYANLRDCSLSPPDRQATAFGPGRLECRDQDIYAMGRETIS